jgi:hypothetical protein
MSDTPTPTLEQMLYGNLEKDPAALAADFTAAAGVAQPPAANAKLLPDPDDSAGHDPADPVAAAEAAEAAKDAGQYPLEPDAAVTSPEVSTSATDTTQPEASPAPAAVPAPAHEPQDLAPVFSQALQDYNAAATAAQEAAQRLADLQSNAEGIVEFTPEMAAALEDKMKAEANAERAFEEIGDDALALAIQQFPELADDNSPATIAVKTALEASPDLAVRSPTAVAELGVKIAQQLRAQAKQAAPPAAQPKPAPGPVPAKAAAPASAMTSHAQAQRPAPGQPATPDIVTQVAQAAQAGSLKSLFGSVLGAGAPVGIRMS